ncbi:MAG TPA: hypothetical protein VE092_12640 [Herbaspirillum sp.]|uniref:hypothetical protein n=1 Tax=Herbaspirillum sp. TaxID=1890675 RepID=UPI002D4422EE|nr:hypothetical protein [Herbaspirillum sp.]HZG20859.1 hypothetical protein [Herbaspirillum sp.]
MGNGPSPLESLAAFAIAFVAGALSVEGISIYANVVREKVSASAADATTSD